MNTKCGAPPSFLIHVVYFREHSLWVRANQKPRYKLCTNDRRRLKRGWTVREGEVTCRGRLALTCWRDVTPRGLEIQLHKNSASLQ